MKHDVRQTAADAVRSTSILGFLPIGVMFSAIMLEYGGGQKVALLTEILAVATIAAFVWQVRVSRVAFVVIGILLVLWAAATRADWIEASLDAVRRGSIVIALFTALSALRTVAMSSEAILDCGRFLARQRPGLRYTALTIGGHLFALILLYGSISLLGSLATESAAKVADPELRGHRIRRMMVAIQRGFASTLCWSPLGFSMAITLAIVPGASWPEAAPACLGSALIMLVIGWAMDAIFKPKLKTPPPPRDPETARWMAQLRPLLMLLAMVMLGVVSLHLLTGVEVIGAVMSLVPAIAVIWMAIQPRPSGFGVAAWTGSRVMQFVLRDIPGYRGEIVLLFMAGFIGSLGSYLLVPLVSARGIDLTHVPPAIILIAIFWLIPLTGQLGMNPILAASLMVPLLPSAEVMGISPVPLVVAITGGWALSGTTSPFTASVLIAASLGRVDPRVAGLGWNGIYTLVAGFALSIWVLLLAHFL